MVKSRRKRIILIKTVVFILCFVSITSVAARSVTVLNTTYDDTANHSSVFQNESLKLNVSSPEWNNRTFIMENSEQIQYNIKTNRTFQLTNISTSSENFTEVLKNNYHISAKDTKNPSGFEHSQRFVNSQNNSLAGLKSEFEINRVNASFYVKPIAQSETQSYQTDFNIARSFDLPSNKDIVTPENQTALETMKLSDSKLTTESRDGKNSTHENSSRENSTTLNSFVKKSLPLAEVQEQINYQENLAKQHYIPQEANSNGNIGEDSSLEDFSHHQKLSAVNSLAGNYESDYYMESPSLHSTDSKPNNSRLKKRYWDADSLFPNRQTKSAFSELESLITKGQKENTHEALDSLNPVHVLQQWENLEESFRESVDAVVRQALPLLIRASSEINLSDGCYTSFFQLLLGLRKLRPWAFQMIDAFGKPPAGMLQGTVTSFGAYDECVNIVATSDPKGKTISEPQQYFRGKYCTVEIKPPLPPKPQYYTMYQPVSILANFSSSDDNVIRQAAKQAHAFYFLTYRMDVCVPSTCTQEDVNNMAQLASRYVDIEVAVPRCSVKESLDLDDSQIAIICVVVILVVLVVLATLLDILREIFHAAKALQQCLSCAAVRIFLYFSMNSNANLLFKTETSKNGLDSMRGMRFFGMAWLVLGYTYFNSNAQMYGNLTEASAFAEGFLFQVIVNSTVSIDTFFFISGLLLAYLTLQYVNKEGIYSIPRLLVRRYVRIVPSYMMVIGATFVLPHLGSGPFWNETVDPVVENCRKNWWTNLLFINNFITTPEERCLEHSWYLSCDFQLFIVALFVLLAIIKRPILGLILNFSLVIISMVLTGLLTYFYNVPPTLLASFPDPQERKFLNHVVISKPYCHLGPYCIGLATGYVFYNCREIKLKAYHHLLGWGSSFAVTAAVVYGVLEWNKGNLPSTPVAVAYAATHRTAWALGLSWIAVICVSGYGGIISRILSWKVFIPLSRLTHIVYLVHPLIQYILTGYIRERLQTNHIIMAYFFFGHIMTSYALSAACFFLFDGPVASLMSMICGDFIAPAPRLSKQSLPDIKKQTINSAKEKNKGKNVK